MSKGGVHFGMENCEIVVQQNCWKGDQLNLRVQAKSNCHDTHGIRLVRIVIQHNDEPKFYSSQIVDLGSVTLPSLQLSTENEISPKIPLSKLSIGAVAYCKELNSDDKPKQIRIKITASDRSNTC